jgi:DNA topoisomerase I
MAKNLVIVESPAKAKTIEGYLGKDFLVKSSYGHVRDLPKGQLAIDIENNFEPTYEISKDKADLVRELKKLSKAAETVWLATDDDREGEAISWHLAESLDLNEAKTRRIVFREITKKAILSAIEAPRQLDKHLVDAQQARRVLDRLVGYELSPILWKKVQRGLSAGRVQSVAVRLVVEREREIDQFNSESYFKTVAIFDVEKGRKLRAELPEKFATKAEAQAFLDECAKSDFSIQDLEKKPGGKKPTPPFTTSTLQQEAGRKLGFPVSLTMSVAQRLYESGKITYMRTDSLNLSETAIQGAKDEITRAYGSEFCEERRFKTKNQGAQEAHEAIRPTDFGTHSVVGDRNEQRLYDLIWKRAIASQMADAITERTNVTIDVSSSKKKLKAQGEVIKFEGFLKVYIESTDDEEEDEDAKDMLPPLTVGQALDLNILTSTQRFTRASARYTEATLVKKLEEMGIGRPSTYAPTISTIQKREYVEKDTRDGVERKYEVLSLKDSKITEAIQTEITGAEKAKLFPSSMAMVVNDFLVGNFPRVTEFSFTAQIENEFDEIAAGKQDWKKMIESFYTSFHSNVVKSEDISRADVGTSRVIGVHPESGLSVIARLGKFGPMVQIGSTEEMGEEKPQYASLRKGQLMENVNLEEALKLFELPKVLGEFNEHEIVIGIGRFGPYVKYNETFTSLPKGVEPLDVDLEQAIGYIKEKEEADAPVAFYQDKPVQKGTGRFGPFIKWDGMFINVNKKYNFDFLTQEDIEQLIEEKLQKEIDKVLHNWEDEGIRVEKARWGRSVILKGKLKIELDKTVNVAEMSLDEIKAIIEQKTPKKATKAKAAPKAKK